VNDLKGAIALYEFAEFDGRQALPHERLMACIAGAIQGSVLHCGAEWLSLAIRDEIRATADIAIFLGTHH
jgi:hypothetical protein